MIGAEYSDGLALDGKGTCANGQIQLCSSNKCASVGHLGNNVCDEQLRCYYLDGGDCDESFSPFRTTEHTVIYTKDGKKHESAHGSEHHAIPGIVVVAVAVALFVAGVVICIRY
jgi:hypothetical protein